MLGKLNQRLKGKSDGGPYNDLDRESSIASNDGRSTSPFNNSFVFPGGESGNGGLLGSAIELSAAGAGVVPDGMFNIFQLFYFNYLTKNILHLFNRYIYSGPSSQCYRLWTISSKAFSHYWSFLDG